MRTTFYIKFCVCLLCLSVSLGLSAKDATRVSPKQMTSLVMPEDSVHKTSHSMEKAARERNSTERISMPETITEKATAQETATEEISTQEAEPEEVASQEVSTEIIAPEETLPEEEEEKESFVPDSNKAIWYAALCPGLGQIYNRRYWKLPIVASGIVGVSYAISWNGKYYEAYTYAYRDLIDGDPNTNYFRELIPPGASYSADAVQEPPANFPSSARFEHYCGCWLLPYLFVGCLCRCRIVQFRHQRQFEFSLGKRERGNAAMARSTMAICRRATKP